MTIPPDNLRPIVNLIQKQLQMKMELPQAATKYPIVKFRNCIRRDFFIYWIRPEVKLTCLAQRKVGVI